ncbi:MAG: hypothetical protein LBD60_01825 [Puniceicoccales bacterium]|jgi:hypothetical protein|nr:hypothetical protein [Puniceicoccales bacterium]
MVKRKFIGMVVCSVVFVGNCTTSIIASSQGEIEGIKETISNMQQEIERLKNQLAEGRREVIRPFTSSKNAKKYIKKITDDDENPEGLTAEVIRHLQERIEATETYFLKGNGRYISIPEGVIANNWPICKYIEILHVIKRKIPGIAAFCRQKIINLVEAVMYPKWLLMSQCCTWDEQNNNYELDSCASEMIIKDAIRMLYGVTISPEIVSDNVVNDVKQLLNAIKDKNGFRDYFYFEVE